MAEIVLLQLAGIVVLGIAAQWLAWRLRLPAILLLLLFGFVVGPGMELAGFDKLIDPNELLGDLLLPVVSLSVAVILFEGGLTLNYSELKQAGGVIRNLVTVGALVSWLVSAVAARLLLDLSWPLAILLGAILVVTGPTVIGPLLRSVRPTGQTGPILKWEGIVIDPIGAMLAVLVFEAIPTDNWGTAAGIPSLLVGSLQTIVIGSVLGAAGALLMVLLLKRYWIPDYLQNPMTLMVVVAAFAASNWMQHESGLFAVTVMGLVLANQKWVTVTHIVEFKEALTVLLISGLFVVLASRLSREQIEAAGIGSVLFLLVLIVVARPLSVLVSTVFSKLSWRERLFLAGMAPRGIVAAAVASVFAIRLADAGIPGAERLLPATFTVIIGTVLVYGLAAPLLAKRLGLSSSTSGYLVAGANPVALAVGRALKEEKQQVQLVDTNNEHVRTARLAGLHVTYASILSSFVQESVELTGIGRLLAMTPNEEVNSLAALQFARLFTRKNVYQLAPDTGEKGRKEKVSQELRGRVLFGPGVTYEYLAGRLAGGDVLKRTQFTNEFTFAQFRQRYGDSALPMFVVEETGRVWPVTADATINPRPGQALISLVPPPQPQARESRESRGEGEPSSRPAQQPAAS